MRALLVGTVGDTWTDWPVFSDNGVTFWYPPGWRSYPYSLGVELQ